MEHSTVTINSVWDAASYSAAGFGIVFFVLVVVIIAVVAISKLEKLILKFRIKATDETSMRPVEVIDPIIVAAITAAVYEFNRRMLVKSVYLISHVARHPNSWGTRGTAKSRYR